MKFTEAPSTPEVPSFPFAPCAPSAPSTPEVPSAPLSPDNDNSTQHPLGSLDIPISAAVFCSAVKPFAGVAPAAQ